MILPPCRTMKSNLSMTTMWRPFARSLAVLLVLGFVAACGGTTTTGGGSGTPTMPGTTPPPPAPPPPGNSPALSFTANPSSIANGASTTLSWSASNVSSCTASGAWSGSRALSGSQTTGALTTTSTFVLTCSGSNGSVTRSVTVTVGPPPIGSTVVSVQMQDQSGASAGNIPVTFAQVFAPGHVPSGATLVARTAGGSSVNVPIQVDVKARHGDGSLRHAVLTTRLPTLAANGTTTVELVSSTDTPPGGSVSLNQLLDETSFDAVVQLNVGGTTYQASARQLLQAGSARVWLSGPMVTEWMVAGPVTTGGGTPHPHLSARFNVRAYAGMDAVRVDVIVENAWALESGPRNYNYDVTVNVDGRTQPVLSQNSVTHYRQARWRRVFWWGTEPRVHVRHDRSYLQNTAAVPTYDPSLSIADSTLASLLTEFNNNAQLMGRGLLETYMPAAGGRRDIGPLPSWAALYVITQDPRAKTVTLGNSEQAGSFGIHYRDRATDRPISLDTYPNMTIIGSPSFFPACGGNCSTPYTPDDAHQPSLAYVPYLVTGDHYHLEELQFWANWNLFYQGDHGGSQGLLTGRWVQIRATAWSLRTLGQAAYITPDADPMKAYFVQKLNNNINYFNANFGNNPPTPLGYVPNPPGGGLDDIFATWMDDFLTWSVGHIVNLGFTQARPFFDYKARFPVGRLTNPDYCWILASSYWVPSRDGSGNLFSRWSAYQDAMILGPDSFRGPDSLSSTARQQLLSAPCNSSTMANILGLRVGEMIGYSWSFEGYPSNLQPAVAVAAELGAAGADQAWQVFEGRSVKPSGGQSYNVQPQWAVVPRGQ